MFYVADVEGRVDLLVDWGLRVLLVLGLGEGALDVFHVLRDLDGREEVLVFVDLLHVRVNLFDVLGVFLEEGVREQLLAGRTHGRVHLQAQLDNFLQVIRVAARDALEVTLLHPLVEPLHVFCSEWWLFN